MARLPQSQIVAALNQHRGEIAAAAKTLGVTRPTLSRWVQTDPLLKRACNDARREAQDLDGEREVVFDDPAKLGDIEQLLAENGLEAKDWIIPQGGLIVNRWGPVEDPYRQLKLRLSPRTDLLQPARASVPRIPVTAARPAKGPELWVVCSDHHAPYYDRGLHECMLAFLRDVRPQRGAFLGDTLDLPTISRFQDNPPFAASPQECVQAAFEMLRDYRYASRSTSWVKLKGNHDDRIRNEQLNRAERLHRLMPADNGEPQRDPHCVSTLLHLDELGIDFTALPGSYERGRIEVSPLLGARHGKKTGTNAGAKTLENITYSTLMGHTHSKRDHWRTRWGITGLPEVLRAVEIGTMAMIVDGLGYADDPSWQQGWVTVSVWPDGQFGIDHAVYSNGSVTWRDRRWDSSVAAAVAA